jgi:hypothetical protein
MGSMVTNGLEPRTMSWKKFYFGLAILAALFLLESFLPIIAG